MKDEECSNHGVATVARHKMLATNLAPIAPSLAPEPNIYYLFDLTFGD